MDLSQFNFDNEEDELEQPHYDFKLGYGEDHPVEDFVFHPTFSYKYIDLGVTNYHFHRPEFDDDNDRKIYFEKVKKYSGMSVDDLEKQHYSEHFKLDRYPRSSSTEVKLLGELLQGRKFKDGDAPIMGHFALYTNEQVEGDPLKKSPRIFFFLGKKALIHILFYDPWHEIHPKKN